MKKLTKILCLILAAAMIGVMFTGCGTTFKLGGEKKEDKKEGEHSVVVISVEGYGDITVELYPQYAPETVENFLKLTEEGFYSNTVFHRVMEDFMIQGGGHDAGNLNETKPADSIKGEFRSNGFRANTLKLDRGVIAMARTQVPDSATSQFFIMHADDNGDLTGNYAGFGKVIEGMDVVDKIAQCQVKPNPMTGEVSVPVSAPVIKSIKIKK